MIYPDRHRLLPSWSTIITRRRQKRQQCRIAQNQRASRLKARANVVAGPTLNSVDVHAEQTTAVQA